MDRRQPLPRLWMMTDERQGDALLPALGRLPAGAGVVFRHYGLAPHARRALFEAVKAGAAWNGLTLTLAGPPPLASEWGAEGSHGWDGRGGSGLLRSASVHDLEEIETANRLKLDLVFVSPVFETRSHPGQPALGRDGLMRIAARANMPVVALGGMTAARGLDLPANVYGWAAIDAWTRT